MTGVRGHSHKFLLPLLAASACLSCGQSEYVSLALLDRQPTQTDLGKLVSLDASSERAAQVRVAVRGGKLADTVEAAGPGPLCVSLEDERVAALVTVFPEDLEAVVTAELVEENENCAKAKPVGDDPASLIVTAGSSSTATGTTAGSGGGGTGGAGATGAGGGTAGGAKGSDSGHRQCPLGG